MSNQDIKPYPSAPVEAKVKTTTLATYLTTFGLTVLVYVVQNVDHALLLGFLPRWAESLLLPMVPSLIIFVTGWATRHTPRPDLRMNAPYSR